MKKEEFEKSKRVTEELLDVLEDEFPCTEDVNGLMCTLEMSVAAVLKGVLELDTDAVDFFAEHVKDFMNQSGEWVPVEGEDVPVSDEEERSEYETDIIHDTSIDLANELINTLAQRTDEEIQKEALNLNKNEKIDFMGTTLAHEVAFFMSITYQGHDEGCKRSAMKRFCETVEYFMQNGEIEIVD